MNDKVQLFFTVGLYLAVGMLLITVIFLVKNVEVIKKSPIQYGIDHSEFDSCVCYAGDNPGQYFVGTGDNLYNMVIQNWTG